MALNISAAVSALAGESSVLAALAWVLLVLGALAAARILLALGCAVWSVLRPGKDVKQYGAWAVVTGATDGIGLAMAREFARKGMNVMLVSRDQTKLNECAKQMAEKYNRVRIDVLKADLLSGDPAVITNVKRVLADLDVGVLVNNVGVSYPYAEYFHEIDEQLVQNLVKLNVEATTRLTHIVLPGMVRRKRGAIINVASAAGVLPIGDPLYSVYSATKAYVDFFSRSLHYELKSKGIHVQCQVPYFVVSKLSKIRKASLLVPDPNTYARAAVRAIGYEPTVVPYWPHALQHFLLTSLPNAVLAHFLLGHHHGIRKRALAKKEKA